MPMTEKVTEAEAEVLWARGWRAERTILDGPRVVLNGTPYYATIVPGAPIIEGGRGGFHWNVWTRYEGEHRSGGWAERPVDAADRAEQSIHMLTKMADQA